MAEASEKQTSTFQNYLFRAEVGSSMANSPTIQLISTNHARSPSAERNLAACVYEVAAALERGSESARWSISVDAQRGQGGGLQWDLRNQPKNLGG
jgi:hypothetical protein